MLLSQQLNVPVDGSQESSQETAAEAAAHFKSDSNEETKENQVVMR